jgi:hypothetical protein
MAGYLFTAEKCGGASASRNEKGIGERKMNTALMSYFFVSRSLSTVADLRINKDFSLEPRG